MEEAAYIAVVQTHRAIIQVATNLLQVKECVQHAMVEEIAVFAVVMEDICPQSAQDIISIVQCVMVLVNVQDAMVQENDKPINFYIYAKKNYLLFDCNSFLYRHLLCL